jgi:NAD+ synthase (glutamine-hydrolysing)
MLKIILAQLNFRVGDIDGNAQKIIDTIKLAETEHQADLVVFPELALTGYPPEDLLLRDDFFQKITFALERIKAHCQDIAALIGTPHKTNKGVYNAALMLHQQKIIAQYYKQYLPNYGVFDEQRYFIAGDKPCVVVVKGVAVGITICEDLWYSEPAAQLEKKKIKFMISLNASPFDTNKTAQRYEVIRARQKETGLSIIYLNLVGGQDELVFDGGSFALDITGKKILQMPFFEENLAVIEVDRHANLVTQQNVLSVPPNVELVYRSLVLALRDYVHKNNFHDVLLGLSGGIDSALTLAIAVDALGAEHVHGVMLPSKYTSELSVQEAERQAKLQNVKYSVISIDPLFQATLASLKEASAQKNEEVTEQNIQARCRMIMLMAMSNNTGALLLNTSNKSELAVGYGTLYGDMAGAFAVLKDVYKTMVYQLANYRNKISPVISRVVIDREPTAELAPNQVDQDSLPAYSILDEILRRYIEQRASLLDIIFARFDRSEVEHVLRLVKQNEYKRRQGPPGPKVTPCAFARERRFPITSGFDATNLVKKS